MNENLREILKTNMKYLRSRKGFSQAKLAELASISTSHVAEIETSNRFPSPEVLARIAYALGVSSARLLMSLEEASQYESFYNRQEFYHEMMKDFVQEMRSLIKSEKDIY